MKQKAQGVQDPVRSKKEEKKPDEEILIKEMEEMMKSDKAENSSALPQPAWVRGEQNPNNVDEFWRYKDQISGNSMGDPAPTGGTGTTEKDDQEDGAAGNNSSQPQASLPSTSATQSPNCQDNQNQKRETPSKLASHGNNASAGRMQILNASAQATMVLSRASPPRKSSSNEASSKISHNRGAIHHTRSNPPPVIHSVYIPSAAAAAPTVPGAQPGSPFFPNSAEQQHIPKVLPPHYSHPPPTFLPPPSGQSLYSVPPPALPPAFIPPCPPPTVDKETAHSLRGMLEDITAELVVENALGANLPCRNGVLDQTDIVLLEHCNRISLSAEKQDILEKVTKIVEKSMKNLSDALVRQAAVDAGRQDLVDLLDDARNNNGMKILQRKKSEPTEAEIKQKKDLNELRQVTNLFRVGALPMKNLLHDHMVVYNINEYT
ncbi:unnamed protein product [Oikopleura dioica]|uniref:Uncharacterized protein n=1 Tax=Oikopleura dioica TaxID=34765 RepID=E4YLR2_OIKDI|nr:unnamed protein product [Oikopleura dioica]